MNLRNATAPLNLSSLATTLNSWAGLSTTPTHDAGAANYKMAAIDMISFINRTTFAMYIYNSLFHSEYSRDVNYPLFKVSELPAL